MRIQVHDVEDTGETLSGIPSAVTERGAVNETYSGR